MKKISFFLFIIFTLYSFTSCYNKAGTDILFDLEYLEIDEVTKPAESRNFKFIKQTAGQVSRDSIIINYAARPKGQAVNFSYQTKEITRDLSSTFVKAVYGVHYRLAGTTSTTPTGFISVSGSNAVPAGSNFGKIPIEAITDNMDFDKKYIFGIRLVSADVSINQQYQEGDFIFSLSCPPVINFSITPFQGAYSCLEPGYGTYSVNITNVNTTTINNNNFWDSGISLDYVFDPVAKTVTIVTKNVPVGVVSSTGTGRIASDGPGTYDGCFGFKVPYVITNTTTNAVIERNTHTFKKN